MVANLVLLALISLVPGVSGWGHLGGLLAGAMLALLLHLERFGPALVRWPAALGVALVPAVAYAALEHTYSDEKFEQRFLRRTTVLPREADRLYRKEVEPLLKIHASRRDAGAVEELLPRLDALQAQLAELAGQLEKAGPRHHPDTENARGVGRDCAAASAELLEQAARCLRAGEQCTPRDERALDDMARRVEKLRAAWRELLE
jgi:hypothetical protein